MWVGICRLARVRMSGRGGSRSEGRRVWEGGGGCRGLVFGGL